MSEFDLSSSKFKKKEKKKKKRSPGGSLVEPDLKRITEYHSAFGTISIEFVGLTQVKPGRALSAQTVGLPPHRV